MDVLLMVAALLFLLEAFRCQFQIVFLNERSFGGTQIVKIRHAM